MMRTYFILLSILVFQHEAFSQFFFPVKDTARVNKLTCPLINRPLTLYKNQLQATTVWEYHILYNRYNEKNEIVNLAQAGETSFRQDFNLNLDYGITDYLQAGVEIGYTNAMDKKMEKIYIDPGSLQYTHKLNMEAQTKGIKDLSIGLRYLLPIKSKLLSLAIESGTTLPIGNTEIARPDTSNTYSSQLWLFFLSTHNMTKYNSTSNGAIIGDFNLNARFGANKLAAFLTFGYSRGLAEKQINDWSTDLYFKKIQTTDIFTGEALVYNQLKGFDINETKYNYSYGNYFKTNVYLAWQIKPYFVTKFGVNGFLHTGSYKKYESNTEYLPDEYNLMAFAAYELQVTPRLRFQQSVAGTFYGMNTKIPVIIYTSIVFNAFL